MLVCYDKVFPEAARALALDGAEIVASLAAWPVCRLRPAARTRHDRQVAHFDLLDRARAVENQVVWASANQTGRLGRLRFPGHAKVVDPDGRVLAATGTRPGAAVARIDARAAVAAARGEISHIGDRQPGSYGSGPAMDAFPPDLLPALAA
jgi:predicted amidohydrolase